MALRFIIPGSFNNPDLPVLDVVGFQDTFTRADSSSLGHAEFPARPWETMPTDAVQAITGGSAYVTRSGNPAATIAVVDALTADGTLTATLGKPQLNHLGLAFRVASVTDHWRITSHAVGGLFLVKTVGNTSTTVQNASSFSVEEGDELSVELAGPSIRVFLRGEEVMSATDTALQGLTRHGWYSNGGAANLIHDVKFMPSE